MRPEIVLKHEFVEFMPSDPKAGVIYVSMRFGTASHLCCCGCGNKVVTPLRPTDWKLIFDGKSVSLEPSIGNWSFACRSHYWIRNNRVQWAEDWPDEKVQAGRTFDAGRKKSYFGKAIKAPSSVAASTMQTPTPAAKVRMGLWQRAKSLFWWK